MRTRLILLGAALLAAPLVATATPAAAAPPDRYGFAYVEKEVFVGSYVPDMTRQWVSNGMPASTVSFLGTGSYRVQFPGIATDGGIAHVTAVNRTGQWCQVAAILASGANELVDVRCFSPGGVPANSRFTVLFDRRNGTPAVGGAAAAVRATAAGGTAFSYSSTGGTNTVIAVGGGEYKVTLPGVGVGPSLTGGLQVSAYGTVPGRCKVAGWSTTPAGQEVVVRCVDGNGNPGDRPWTLSYQHQRSIVRGTVVPTRFGYLFDGPGGPSYNSLGGAVTVAGGGTGLRTVTLGLIGAPQDHAQVTAYGTGPEYCTLTSPWTTVAGTVTQRYVACFAAGGTLSTQPSLVTYTSRT